MPDAKPVGVLFGLVTLACALASTYDKLMLAQVAAGAFRGAAAAGRVFAK